MNNSYQRKALLMLLATTLVGISALVAQVPDSLDDISIPLRREAPAQVPLVPRGGFFQRFEMVRVPLTHPRNSPLRITNLYPVDQHPTGIIFHLIKGLRDTQIHALNPVDPSRAYRYVDLLFDLAELEGLPDSALDALHPHDLNWEALEVEMDLLRLDRIDRHGFQHKEVIHIGLLWTPEAGSNPVLLALIPFENARSWLDQLECQWAMPDGRKTGTTATRYLEGEMYVAIPYDPQNPQRSLLGLPNDDRSARVFPELFDQH